MCTILFFVRHIDFMAKGPHDEEIEDQDSGEDHAKRRLEELLKRREPARLPAESDEPGSGGAPQDRDPKS